MAPKLFMTGVTGYIGGTAFDSIVNSHPEYEITAYLRKTPANFSSRYPNVKIIHGSWDDSEILYKAASQADIVVQCGDSDHLGAPAALLDGLRSRKKKVFYIHLSGTGLLTDARDDYGASLRGKLNPFIYSDIDHIDKIVNRPPQSLHQPAERLIRAKASACPELNVAIVCPPDVYGRGSGPGKTESLLLRTFIRHSQRLGHGFYYGEGVNRKGWVHVDDLAQVYLKLVEAAAAGGGNATWGREGYYFTATSELSHKELATAVCKLLHKKGALKTPEPRQVGSPVIASLLAGTGLPADLAFYLYANNSRSRPDRAVKELGYQPKAPSFFETLEDEVDVILKPKSRM